MWFFSLLQTIPFFLKKKIFNSVNLQCIFKQWFRFLILFWIIYAHYSRSYCIYSIFPNVEERYRMFCVSLDVSCICIYNTYSINTYFPKKKYFDIPDLTTETKHISNFHSSIKPWAFPQGVSTWLSWTLGKRQRASSAKILMRRSP